MRLENEKLKEQQKPTFRIVDSDSEEEEEVKPKRKIQSNKIVDSLSDNE